MIFFFIFTSHLQYSVLHLGFATVKRRSRMPPKEKTGMGQNCKKKRRRKEEKHFLSFCFWSNDSVMDEHEIKADLFVF